MLEQTLMKLALDAGASKATVIEQSQIVLSDSFFAICATNQCGAYGRCWICPPELGDIHDLMNEVRRFPRGLWYQYIAKIEDSFDIEGMFAAGKDHAWLGQRIETAVTSLLSGPHLHLSCGGCHLCPTCAKVTGEPCRMPGKALPPLEGYGVDVYQTTKSTDLSYINGQNTVTYFGMVLFDE